MASKDIVIYKYSRGPDYSCYVTIINGEIPVFSNIIKPPTATDEVVAKMLDDAEEEAMKEFTKEEDKSWVN